MMISTTNDNDVNICILNVDNVKRKKWQNVLECFKAFLSSK